MTIHNIDPIQALSAYAPTAPSDDDLDAGFSRVWQQIEAAPTLAFRARHRKVTAVGVAAVITLAGVGAAAAAGAPLPGDVTRAFSSFTDYSGHHLADPSTAQQVFSIPGPEGTTFEGWTATNSDGGLCVTTTFEQGNNAGPPDGITTGGGQCADAHAPSGLFAEGDGNSLGPNRHDRADFVWESGAAVRAELRVSTGHIYPIEIQNGWLGGWFGLEQIPLGATATIVTYGADGAVLQTFDALDQNGCPTTGQPC